MPKPTKCISVTEAKELCNNWMSSRGASLTSSRGSQDTSDFTFSLSEMEEFLAYVREESTDKATVILAPTKGVDQNSDINYDVDPMNRSTQGWPPNIY